MKGFVFRLERVFRLRAQVERQRAQALAQAIHEEQERRDALERAAERLERCSQQIAGTEGQIANAGSLRNLGMTVEAAARQIEAARTSHLAASDAVESEQERFGQARMERRVVERLRERRRAAWDVEQSQAEQREQDGLAARRHPRKEEP
jgi:flagellar export protein FliJ